MLAYTVANNTLVPTQLPDPLPGPGQVTIDVDVAGLGLIDALWTSGAMPSTPGFVPGLEVSGTVRALGEGVTGLSIGDVVAAALPGAGGFAEIACASAQLVAPLPPSLSRELAAVVPINTVTAHLALTTVARFTSGENLLVHAGVGGLGSQFAQVAHTLGAGRLDAVVGSSEKAERAHDFGYSSVYLRSDLATVPTNAYDIVVDPVGGEATTTAFRALRAGGRLIRVGNASQEGDVPLSSIAHWLENKSTVGFNVGGWLAAHPKDGAASLRWALEASARGDVRVDLTRIEGHGRLRELLTDLEQGRTTGKLAVRMRA
ncbi:quinone oxidoreductase family protein [Rothia nasisuis]|uniref:quinone oxidoreductase family protein n=1 Tax=Rothia nasisuis TaxID=2109647 RepID=UPI001F17FA11|nr:zinc-binding dehydrogenase [Rothia nasisuis]